MHLATPEQIAAFLDTPGSTQIVVHKVQRVEMTPIAKENQLQRQRDHWKRLHTQQFDETTFEKWVSTIPGCPTCQREFRKLLETHPPRFNDWFRWTWEVHNAVNTKLNKPNLTYSEACELWKPNPLPPDTVSESPDQ